MGISVSFYGKKASHAWGTHCTCSRLGRILKDCGLSTQTLQNEYYVELPAKRVIHALNDYLKREHRKTVIVIGWDGTFRNPQLSDDYVFVKQIVSQYNEMCSEGVKPTKFGGA